MKQPFRYRFAHALQVISALVVLAVCEPCRGDLEDSAWRVHIAPVEQHELFGMRVGSAGHLNDDGVPDYFIAAPGPFNAAVRLYSGASGETLHVLVSQTSIDFFGFAVVRVGDVDGDNYDDIAIGAPLRSISNGFLGAVDLFSGQTGERLWSVAGEHGRAGFGWALAAGGDLNNDGVPDLVVAAPLTTSGQHMVGRLYVISGANGDLLHAIDGPSQSLQAGFTLAMPDDFDGDGITDIAAAAPSIARVFLISTASGALIDTLSGQAGSSFGFGLAAAGDVDDDGVGDLIVGAPRFAIGGVECGRVWVYSGATRKSLMAFTGADRSELGYCVGAAGDVDGDGHDDFIIGARKHPVAMNLTAGRVQVHSGQSGNLLRVINGDAGHRLFGASVADLGDVNADEVPDMIVGQMAYSTGTAAAYIFSGLGSPPGEMSMLAHSPGWMPSGQALAADLDLNGADDLLTIGVASNRVSVRMNRGDGHFYGVAHLAVGAKPVSACLVDLDRDGDRDMVVALQGENRLAVYWNTHGVMIRSGTIKVGRRPQGVVAGDFNGDGRQDLAVINRKDRNVMVFLGRHAPTQYLHERFTKPRITDLGLEPASLHAVKLDDAGRTDLAVVSRSGGTVLGLLSRGNGRFLPPRATTLDAQPTAITFGDFDGDGRDDLAWSDGASPGALMQRGSGDGRFAPNVDFLPLHGFPLALQSGDFNADGIIDLTASTSGAAMVLMASSPGAHATFTYETVGAHAWIAHGDFDSDEDLDIALLNPDGSVTLLLNHAYD